MVEAHFWSVTAEIHSTLYMSADNLFGYTSRTVAAAYTASHSKLVNLQKLSTCTVNGSHSVNRNGPVMTTTSLYWHDAVRIIPLQEIGECFDLFVTG